MNLSPIVHTRIQAAGMWQALLEEGVLVHGKLKFNYIFNCFSLIFFFCFLILVNKEQPFKDKCFLYRFRVDEDNSSSQPQADDVSSSNEHIRESLGALLHRGPDATLRMILRKP